MKFQALLPLAGLLLLVPSCGSLCRKDSSSCYRKACPTGISTMATYPQAISCATEPCQGPLVEATTQGSAVAPEFEEIEEEDELDAAEGFTREELPKESSKAPVVDKESLDDEMLEVD